MVEIGTDSPTAIDLYGPSNVGVWAGKRKHDPELLPGEKRAAAKTHTRHVTAAELEIRKLHDVINKMRAEEKEVERQHELELQRQQAEFEQHMKALEEAAKRRITEVEEREAELAKYVAILEREKYAKETMEKELMELRAWKDKQVYDYAALDDAYRALLVSNADTTAELEKLRASSTDEAAKALNERLKMESRLDTLEALLKTAQQEKSDLQATNDALRKRMEIMEAEHAAERRRGTEAMGELEEARRRFQMARQDSQTSLNSERSLTEKLKDKNALLRIRAEDLELALREAQMKIQDLEKENARLRALLSSAGVATPKGSDIAPAGATKTRSVEPLDMSRPRPTVNPGEYTPMRASAGAESETDAPPAAPAAPNPALANLQEARAALSRISRADLEELRSYTHPVASIVFVMEGTCALLRGAARDEGEGADDSRAWRASGVVDRSRNHQQPFSYTENRILHEPHFLQRCQMLNVDGLTEDLLDELWPFVSNPLVTVDSVSVASLAASGIYRWLCAVFAYANSAAAARSLEEQRRSLTKTPAKAPEPVVDAKLQPIASGMRATVRGAEGTVRFVGPTAFRPGVWVGVEMDERVGKNNGTVDGRAYFVCPERTGIFIRPSHCEVVPPPANSQRPGHRPRTSMSPPRSRVSRKAVESLQQNASPPRTKSRSPSPKRPSPTVVPSLDLTAAAAAAPANASTATQPAQKRPASAGVRRPSTKRSLKSDNPALQPIVLPPRKPPVPRAKHRVSDAQAPAAADSPGDGWLRKPADA